eukprot:SAG11_NODE_38665_length_251_cov_0.842105_1_plen_44_part_01
MRPAEVVVLLKIFGADVLDDSCAGDVDMWHLTRSKPLMHARREM